MASKFYPSLKVVIDGNLITEIQDATLSWDAALNEINTQVGLEGFTEGARSTSLSGKIPVPTSGPQFNPVDKMDKRETMAVQVFVGPLSTTSEMTVTTASVSWSEAAETGFNFEAKGDWSNLI